MTTELRAAEGPGRSSPVRFVFAGVGGQGSLFASLLLGDAAAAAGLEVVLSEIHGMSQRGGSVVSTVVIGPAHGPLVEDGAADALVAFEPIEALRAVRCCSARTTAVVALAPWVPPSVSLGAAKYPALDDVLDELRRICGRVIPVDADRIAAACGVPRGKNVIVLGALAASGVLPFDARFFRDAIRLRLMSAAHDPSWRAFEAGRDEVARTPSAS